jgi:T-complex protein 1 subunit alpha
MALSDLQSINILKAHGKSAKDSYLLNGYALSTGRAAQGMPSRVTPARIACLDFNLQKTKMQLGVQVLVTDPRELEKIRQRYLQYLLECCLFLIC